MLRKTACLSRSNGSRRGNEMGTKVPFFCGYYGCGNLGDDALLLSIVDTISRDIPSVEPLCLSGGDPTLDGALRERGIRIVKREPRAILRAIRACDVVAFGGGSLLQNATGNASLYAYLSILSVARLCGKETAILSGGLGPITGSLPLRSTALFLRRVNYASFRDEEACAFARSLGVRSPKRAGDPALLLPIEPYRGELPDRFLVVTLRKKSGIPARDIAEVIMSIAEKRMLTPVFCTLFPREDGDYVREVFDLVCTQYRPSRQIGGAQMLPFLSQGKLRSVVARASFVIAGRYHLALFAFEHAIPFSVIGEDPKLRAISKERRTPEELREAARADLARFSRMLKK